MSDLPMESRVREVACHSTTVYKSPSMELTCWHCSAIFNPEATGRRCPHCGYHSAAWLAKLRFAAADFIGPIALLVMGLYSLSDNPGFSALLMVGCLVWAGFIHFQDTGDWVEKPAADLNLGEPRRVSNGPPLSKPPIPDSWKRLTSVPCPRELETASGSYANPPRMSAMQRVCRLTCAEKFLLAALVCGAAAYVIARWRTIENFVQHGQISLERLAVLAVVLCLILFAVRRVHVDEQVLRDGMLTTGVLTGWYENSSYTRTGYHSYTRIRYQFWTESGKSSKAAER